jgi:3-carboxy-cis,cis-muconate cycloisomerase
MEGRQLGTSERIPWFPLLGTFGDAAMAAIFTEAAAIADWLAVERALAATQGELGLLRPEEVRAVLEAATPDRVDPVALRAGTTVVGYPILPLIELVSAGGSPAGSVVHLGATTQDIMDTALALQLDRASDRLAELVEAAGDALAGLTETFAGAVMAGRTHAMQAVPTTFGAKCAVWLSEMTRHRRRISEARAEVGAVSLFGAAGTGAAFGARAPEIRTAVAARLGLADADVPWHTARDGIAAWGFAAALAATTCGKIAREVIDLGRTEIGEVREAGGRHRGASSTMPQKANPIASEVIVAFSTLAASRVTDLLAATQGGHERAAGEWQIEWDALPGVATAAAGALASTVELLRGLSVDADRMLANLAADGGLIMAEAAMIALAPGVGRMRAHDLVYDAASAARRHGVSLEVALRAAVATDPALAAIPIDGIFRPESYLGETDRVCAAAVTAWRATS